MREQIINADALDGLALLESGSVDMCVTSPPYYGLRDYGMDGQIGLEETPDAYVERLVGMFREVRRVLRDDGTLWVNIGDSYAAYNSGNNGYQLQRTNRDKRMAAGVPSGVKPKDLIGIPWMLAFALRADGWYLRQDIIWHKPNPMPESVTDRCTKSHEHIFLLSKAERYFWNQVAMQEQGVYPAGTLAAKGSVDRAAQEGVNARPPEYKMYNGMRNKRDVWTVATRPYAGAHFATFPPDLIRPCILAGSRPSGTVLDPFFGAGTTGLVALEEGRGFVGIELNPEYVALAKHRLVTANIQFKLPFMEPTNDNQPAPRQACAM